MTGDVGGDCDNAAPAQDPVSCPTRPVADW